jgi:hypothetical protein
MESIVACRTYTKAEAVIAIGFAPSASAIASCNKIRALYVQFRTLYAAFAPTQIQQNSSSLYATAWPFSAKVEPGPGSRSSGAL